MITFIRRAEKRYNYYQEDGKLSIEVSFHYGHNKWMYECYSTKFRKSDYHFDTFIDAMDRICMLVDEEYRVMDQADLELEQALLEE